MPDDNAVITPETPEAPTLTIDPDNLPADVQAIIDRERTKASQTARANALKDAAKDPKIQAQVRAALEEEARMTADERVAQKERELEQKQLEIDVRRNTLTVESMLIGDGIEKESAIALAAALATADEKLSTKQAEAFIASFRTAVDTQVTALKNELLANGAAPKKGDAAPSTEEQYKAAYKEATEKGDIAQAISIQRRAATEGIAIQ